MARNSRRGLAANRTSAEAVAAGTGRTSVLLLDLELAARRRLAPRLDPGLRDPVGDEREPEARVGRLLLAVVEEDPRCARERGHALGVTKQEVDRHRCALLPEQVEALLEPPGLGR